MLTPIGIQVDRREMRPQALALSPDGRLLVTSGKTHELVVVNPRAAILCKRSITVKQATNAEPTTVSTHISTDKDGQVSYTGLIFSADGSAFT